ncbi:RmlC-like cupin [Delitschia confertaspora ATCC 74209]|uniref:RmlC-like cupin n=1 Tax=Delitschia confertaspora ATCC 74209 TaxID=1513339 RepID=A0A9P4MPE4_9PLEO|nr:RmlC-like cupin [Delitschia confertaspora ATCC 74209]
MSPFSFVNVLTLALLAVTTVAVDRTVNPSLNAKLKLDTTSIDRHSDLLNDLSWRFDFNEQPNYSFKPGGVINANAATFPALTGLGMTLAVLNLGPCAMLPPHFHPRATNLVVAVQGETDSFMVGENGVDMVKQRLTPGVMTIFPKGSLHMMANTGMFPSLSDLGKVPSRLSSSPRNLANPRDAPPPLDSSLTSLLYQGCTNAQLISALDSEDTGTTNIFNSATRNFPSEYLQAAFGDSGLDIAALAKNIPEVGTGSIPGSAECQRKCVGLSAPGDASPTTFATMPSQDTRP